MSNLRDKLTEEEYQQLEESLIGRKQPYDNHTEFIKQLEINQRFPVSDEQVFKTDPIVDKVLTKFSTRSRLGITKYGTTLQENNLSLYEWLNHLQEELMDATLYIEKLKQNVK